MNNFQNYVLVTTMGCLLIGLIVTAVFLMKQKSDKPYPPVIDNCPDYWVNTYYDKDKLEKKYPSVIHRHVVSTSIESIFPKLNTNSYSAWLIVFQDIFVLSMLDGKENGTFLEIGGAKPFERNKTIDPLLFYFSRDYMTFKTADLNVYV